jgi:hypothetical protein
VNTRWKHTLGFRDDCFVHIPWDMVRQLRELQPDVVISAELGFRSLLAARYCARPPRTPLLLWCGLSEHTEQGRGRMRYLLRRRLLRKVDCVITNGESGSRYLQKMGLARSRIRRVHYPTIPGIYERGSDSRPPAAAHSLLFVGQLIERKGVLPFTKALVLWAAEHPQRQVDFDLVGSGPLRDALERIQVPKNLRFRLRGQCTYDETIEAFAKAGIFVFPTLADEWGMAVNEAMASGLPVLGSVYSQAVEEMCVPGRTGWVFRPDVPQEMASAIDAALSTPADQINRMRPAVRECVRELTPEHAVDEVIAAICDVVERREYCPRHAAGSVDG